MGRDYDAFPTFVKLRSPGTSKDLKQGHHENLPKGGKLTSLGYMTAGNVWVLPA